MGEITAKVKVPLTGFVGVGTGASVGTLGAEWVSRSTGQTKWNACAVKGAVKFGVGLILYGVSTRIMSPLTSFFCEMFAYGSWGSWFLDVAMTAYPGGIPGLAEDWAIAVRTMAAGGKKVVRELSKLEGTPTGAKAGEQVASAMF